MKHFEIKLAGSKLQGSPDLKTTILANNIGQATNLAKVFFQQGEKDKTFGDESKGFYHIKSFFPEYESLKGSKHKYKVGANSIKQIK